MNAIFKIIILAFLYTTLQANSSDYYQVDEFLKKTNQVQTSENFVKMVQSPPVIIESALNKKVKVMMVYPGNQVSDYWRKSKLSFEKRMAELNISYELTDYFTKPGIEINEQAKYLLEALKSGTDYLIFTLDAKKHARFIERIIANENIKLILQNITTPLKKWGDKQAYIYVGFDHTIGSKYLADYYMKETSGKGKYAVLYGTKGYVSFMRGTKFIEYVSSNSDLELVHEYYTDFNKQKAKLATLNLLKIDNNIEFIYACSTDIALGAIEALKEKNLLGKIKVNGWGGGSSELSAIQRGDLDITVMRMNDDNGVAMAEAVKLDLEGKEKYVPTIFSGDFAVVKKGINQDELEKLKRKAFRYTLDD